MSELQKQILAIDMYNAFQMLSESYKVDLINHLKANGSTELLNMITNNTQVN